MLMSFFGPIKTYLSYIFMQQSLVCITAQSLCQYRNLSPGFLLNFAAGSDYVPLVNASVFLGNNLHRHCFQISITNDSEIEISENFTLHIMSNELFTPPNVRFEPSTARVSIRDVPGKLQFMTECTSICKLIG